MVLLIEHPGGSTCKKAAAWLTENGVAFARRDIRSQNPTAEEVRVWQAASGLPLRRFFNTSGQKYRDLALKEKLETMSIEQQLALLASDGMLVKRPILLFGDGVLVGFRPAAWQAVLPQLQQEGHA